ncbi:TonB-dependent receptor plug domain-containing protein [Qipengyuania sp. ASV99]|uniref:TonB-dependent receptor plug domain-containing protein n=1 Tax=Qipengyuania sp. ASV99 TaxID=3399681 RepID=UPI003A4C56C4
MKISTTLRLSVGTAALGMALSAVPAFAQDAETAPEATQGDVIVVTGSRTTNPNLTLSSPVAVIDDTELQLRQTTNAESFLRELPSAVPSIGSAVNNGNGGAAFVNLRGIGSQRNLVLLDGRRFVPADETGRVDLNNIPLAVIERTDILTGGATTTYGADAISGVVNFITKRDFEGAQVDASSGVTEEGDGESYRVDLTLGANFADGRGNAVLSIGYQDTKAVFQGDRSFSEFNVGSFSGAASGSSAAVPANIVAADGPDADTAGVVGQINDAGTDITGFNVNPFNFNPFNIFQTPFERYNMFGSARYEISDAVELYSQGVFSKQTVSTIIAPGGSFFNTYQLNLNNPFIPDAIAQRFGDNLGLTAAQFTAARNTQFGPTLADGSANPDYVQFASQVRRRSVEAGTRDSDFTTTLFNLVVGARGGITDDISWDVSATYGESERIQRQSGFARFSRLQQSLLAIPDGSGGAVCIDSSSGCAPINLFGVQGNLGSPEAQSFVFDLTQQVIDISSISTVNGLISGDLPFAISETPVAFAIGAEYREFTTSQASDEASQTPGAVVGGGGADPNFSGSYDVKDIFGELIIPIFEGMPLAEELTLELGARYSDYSSAGTELTWKAGGSWEPFTGFKIRGNYQRAARAPNIGELFFPVSTGLSNLSQDPCAGAAPTTNAALAAVCIAQGAPANVVNAGGILQPAAGQINVTSGGNPNLGTEEADTWTVGLLIQPVSIPRLSVTIDYFNIKLEGAIGSPGVGDIIDGCYNSGNLDFSTNPFCQLIERSTTTGGLDGAPNEVRGLLLNQTNLGRLKTDGVDVSVRYGIDLNESLDLAFAFDGTWTNENRFQAIAGDPVSPFRDCVGFYSVNCGSIQPEFTFNQRTTLSFEDFASLSLRWRYLSGTEQEPLDIISQGPAFIGNTALFGDVDFTKIPAESYFDLSAQFNAMENLTLTLTVTNLADNKPTVVGSDIGSTSFNSGNVFPSTYDALGRRYSAAVRFRF